MSALSREQTAQCLAHLGCLEAEQRSLEESRAECKAKLEGIEGALAQNASDQQRVKERLVVLKSEHMFRGMISLIFVLLCAGCATDPSSTCGVPHPSVVAPGLMRGGQPSPEGFKWLVAQGYTNDVKLNVGADLRAQEAGVSVFYFPITTCQQLEGGPDPGMAAEALTIMCRPGTFVHCTHGQDRTGLLVGLYRVQHGWRKAVAYREMKAHGFHPLLKGLYDFWEICY